MLKQTNRGIIRIKESVEIASVNRMGEAVQLKRFFDGLDLLRKAGTDFWRDHLEDIVVTCYMEGHASNLRSWHHRGRAFDLRTRHMADDVLRDFVQVLESVFPEVRLELDEDKAKHYYLSDIAEPMPAIVIPEHRWTNQHIHVEW